MTPEEKLWSLVVKTQGCWIWVRPRTNNGYGTFTVAGQRYLAHRLSYELEHGPVPDGLVVDHLCRNRRCVRPTHLEAVTLAENSRRAHGSWRCIVGHEDDRVRVNAYTCLACEDLIREVVAPYVTPPRMRERRTA